MSKSITDIEIELIDNGAICLSCREWMKTGHINVWENHGGGTPVKEYPNKKPWLSYICPDCGSQYSLNKMAAQVRMRIWRLKANNGKCLDQHHTMTIVIKRGKYNPEIGDEDQTWFVPIDNKYNPEDVIHCTNLKIPETEYKCKECLQPIKGYMALTSQIFTED